MNVAGKIKTRTVLAVDLYVLESMSSGGFAFQIGVGADINLFNVGITYGANRYILVRRTVDNHFRGRTVFQDDTAIALITFAGAAGNDLAVYCNIIERYIAETHTTGDIQVAGDGHIFQRYTGAGNHQVTRNAGRVSAGGLDRCADDAHQHAGDFAAGNIIERAEGTIRIALQDAFFCCCLDISAAPAARQAAICKRQIFTRARLQHQIAAQHGSGFFTRQRCVGRSGCVSGTLKISRGIGRADIVIVPVAGTHIRKWLCTGFGIAEGTIEHGNKFCTRNPAIRV